MPVHHASPEIRGVDTYLGHPIHAGTWDTTTTTISPVNGWA